MKLIFFSLILLILTSLEIKAQSCKTPCPYYNDFVNMAQADTVKNTQTKLNYYRAAIVAAKDCHCPQLEQNANQQIDTLFVIIEAEKRQAELQSQTILQQQNEIKVALKDTEKASIENTKIISALDFYKGEFALAFKNDKYGFINKIGDTEIEFSYDKGEPFNQETGFAEMERGDIKYLIDIEDNEYKLIHISEMLKDGGSTRSIVYQEDIKWLESVAKNEMNALTLLEEEIAAHQNNIEKDSIALRKEKNETIKTYWADQIQTEKEALNLTRRQLEKYSKNRQTEVGNRLDKMRVKLNTIEEDLKIANDRLFNVLKAGNEKLALDFSKQYNLDIIDILEQIASNKFISNKVELLFLNETDLDRIPSFISKFKNLKYLNISGTKIRVLPSSFTDLGQLVRLDLSNTKLPILPKDIGNLTALKYLNLVAIPLTNLPLSFSSLKNLEVLKLNQTKIKVFPKSVLQLSSLKELFAPTEIKEIPINISNLKNLEILSLNSEGGDKDHSYIYSLPESIGQLYKLKKIGFPDYLKELPVSIGGLKNLERLNLTNTRIKIVPESIGQLHNLKTLILPNTVEELPASIGGLKSLDTLNMEGGSWNDKGIQVLPESIGQLHNLKRLILPAKLKELPESIVNLKNLEILDWKETRINTLPELIGQMHNLKTLVLPYTVKELPASIANLKKLEKLYWQGSKKGAKLEFIGELTNLKYLNIDFDTLPLSISKLKNLEILDLGNASLSIIPEFIGALENIKELKLPKQLKKISFKISRLKNLEILDLSKTNLTKLPESIEQLSKLKILYAPYRLEGLPKSFTQLKNLEELDLYAIKIKALPEGFENLTKLRTLILEGSDIDTLLEEVCNLTQLTSLNLRKTKISSLPQNIGNLTKLTSLDLHGTQVEKVPISINQLINLEKLYLGKTKAKDIPDMSRLRNLSEFSLQCYRTDNVSAIKARLKEVKDHNPTCDFMVWFLD